MKNDPRKRNAYLEDRPERTKDLLLSDGRWREAFPNGFLGDVSALTFSWAHQIALLEGDLHISVRGGKVWVRAPLLRKEFDDTYFRNFDWSVPREPRLTLRLIVDSDREISFDRAMIIHTMSLSASLVSSSGSVSLDGELLYLVDRMFFLAEGLLQINPGQTLYFQNVTGTVEYYYA